MKCVVCGEDVPQGHELFCDSCRQLDRDPADIGSAPPATHTPGPWRANLGSVSNDPEIFGEDDSLIAIVAYSKRGMEREIANARLIAAAPELLTELYWLANNLDKAVNGGDRSASCMCFLRNHARALIAKATGVG